MRDEVKPGKWTYKLCEHESFRGDYKYLTGAGPFQYDVTIAQNTTYHDGSEVFLRPSGVVVEEAKKWLQYNTIRPASIEDVIPLFKHSALPTKVYIDRDPFDTEFSVWYLLVDLFDLFTGARRIAKKLAAQPRPRVHSKDTARVIADKHLGFRFGVVPTIADMQEFIHKVNNWKDKYDELKKKVLNGRFRRHQPKVDLSMIFPDWEEWVGFNVPYTNVPVACKIQQTTKASWHGLALYGFTCPEFSGWLGRLAQLIDSFGVLDPTAIWDVIPFSFVLDWFFTTSSWLHKFKPKLFPATAVIHDYLESISVSAGVSYRLRYYAINFQSSYYNAPVEIHPFVHEQTIGVETYKTYVRHRFQPDVGRVSLVSGLNPKRRRDVGVDLTRAGVAASLLAQRIPR